MEHIVQLGICIDDDAIIRGIKENAEKKIITDLERKVEQSLFNSRYLYASTNDPHATFTQLAKDVLNDFLNANKEVILDRASVILADKLARSKAGKAILEDVQ